MIPNWKIGPVARRRLAEMAKAGWNQRQTIYQHKYGLGPVTVELVAVGSILTSKGNTIGLAVAKMYKAWKERKRPQ